MAKGCVTNLLFFALTEHPLKRRASRRARVGSVRRTSTKNRRQSSVRSGSQTSNCGTISRRPNGQLSQRRLVLENRGRSDSSSDNAGQKTDVEAGAAGELFIAKPYQKTVKDHLMGLFSNGWRQFQVMVGLRNEEIITVQEIIKGMMMKHTWPMFCGADRKST